MSCDDENNPQPSSNDEVGEDKFHVSPRTSDTEFRRDARTDDHDPGDSPGLVEDDGRGTPAVDDALLAELVDPEDSAEDRAKKAAVVSQIIQSIHSGPLPPASEFRGYKDVDPSAPGIILEMARNSNQALTNRINAEADAIRVNSEIDKDAVPRGQKYSFFLILGLFALALTALILDRSWFVLLFGAGGLGIMVMNSLPSILNRNSSQKPIAIEDDELPTEE